MAFWQRSDDDGLYTPSASSRGPPRLGATLWWTGRQGPNCFGIRVLENDYLNNYIHGNKFATWFFQNYYEKFRNSIFQAKGS
jgi:hypothetical protein